MHKVQTPRTFDAPDIFKIDLERKSLDDIPAS